MAKPRIYGMNSAFIHNSKADARFQKNIYQRGREIADRPIDDDKTRRGRRELRKLARMKGATA